VAITMMPPKHGEILPPSSPQDKQNKAFCLIWTTALPCRMNHAGVIVGQDWELSGQDLSFLGLQIHFLQPISIWQLL
jgi:hypothetical protein